MSQTPYAERFRRAIAACGCEHNDSKLTPEVFGEEVFGELGEGYAVIQPMNFATIGSCESFDDDAIDAWMASKEIAGNGYEPAFLVDLAAFGEKEPDVQRTYWILCWHASRRFEKPYRAFLSMHPHHGRSFGVVTRGDDWRPDTWFLFRKIRERA